MDVTAYHYLAERSPETAKDIIEHFGYKVVDKTKMGDNLQLLVAQEGEDALRMVMNNHPDKDIILELFATQDKTPAKCEKCKERKIIEKFVNANGSDGSQAKSVENNFSILFLAGVTILAIAIIKK